MHSKYKRQRFKRKKTKGIMFHFKSKLKFLSDIFLLAFFLSDPFICKKFNKTKKCYIRGKLAHRLALHTTQQRYKVAHSTVHTDRVGALR